RSSARTPTSSSRSSKATSSSMRSPDSSTCKREVSPRMKTVLVIDDSEIVLELTKAALEKAGYHVVTRDRPSGSVAAILRDKPDIVLLDVNMPSLQGDVIAKILVRAMKNPDTLILLHSSMSIDTLRLKAVATGAHGYIQKTE